MKESKTMRTDTRVSKLFLAVGVLTVFVMVSAGYCTTNNWPDLLDCQGQKICDRLRTQPMRSLMQPRNSMRRHWSQILGPDSYDIIHTGEPARDREVAQEFAEQARIKTESSFQPNNSRLAYPLSVKTIGPFQCRMVKVGSTWSFDSKAGREELLYRRIGSNELDAIAICRGYR